MKKVISLFILVTLLLIGTAEAREWYEGGTLHSATVGDYLQGDPANVLATTADWVCAGIADSQVQKLNMDDIKKASAAVAICIVTATDGMTEIYGHQATEMAVLCMMQLKNDYPWLLTK